MKHIGFDNEKYLQMQSEQIKSRIQQFGGKLYLEFGGKLYDDFHASRVLPGFEPDSKMRMLLQMKDQAEIVIAINAGDIEKTRTRGDLGITYEQDVLRLIDVFRGYGFYVGSVVLTQFAGQPAAETFLKHLESLGVKGYRHYSIEGYPTNLERIFSDKGYGRNDYIETTRSLVVVTAPGPGSGKLATCLSQLYNENRRGNSAGYAKFETFPIWNISLNHPVNLAYEAATADLNDVNMIDPFHLEAYGERAINYNRDVEAFPLLTAIFKGIYGTCPYQSPTDMGVNMVGNCIVDDEAVRQAAREEIVRRYYATLGQQVRGKDVEEAIYKLEMLMRKAGVSDADRVVIGRALAVEERTGGPSAAIELPDGTIVTGKTTELMGACSNALINALKMLGKIDDSIHLLSPDVITPIQSLKTQHFGSVNPRLHTDEMLLALSVCAVNDKNARLALEQLDKLRGSEMHSTVIVSAVDETVFRNLGVNLTCQAKHEGTKLFHK